MDAGVTPTPVSVKSILEKPLKQLTEEDISQLTREDCRKFLKEKGMRRPSWNKSQAIQQVLSLKALFEPGDDSGAGVLRKILVSPPPENAPRVVAPTSVDSVKGSSVDARVLSPDDENAPCQWKGSPRSAEMGGEKDTSQTMSPRNPGETNASFGQMTIFYCGKVNVYDGMSPDKAQAIMHLAASSIDLPQNDTFGGHTAHWSFPCDSQMTRDRRNLCPASCMISKTMLTEKGMEFPQYCQEKGNTTRDPGTNDVEGQANRKVSLQRYLEKRKDRGRFFKGKKGPGTASSSLEMYLNQQTRLSTSYGQSSRSSTASPPQRGLPQIFCSSADNQTINANPSVDLNSEDV